MSAAQIPAGFILTLDTRHFTFEAHGITEEEAIETMGRTLRAHGKAYELPVDWSDAYADAFKTRVFTPGAGFRDDARII